MAWFHMSNCSCFVDLPHMCSTLVIHHLFEAPPPIPFAPSFLSSKDPGLQFLGFRWPGTLFWWLLGCYTKLLATLFSIFCVQFFPSPSPLCCTRSWWGCLCNSSNGSSWLMTKPQHSMRRIFFCFIFIQYNIVVGLFILLFLKYHVFGCLKLDHSLLTRFNCID